MYKRNDTQTPQIHASVSIHETNKIRKIIKNKNVQMKIIT